LRLEEFLGGRAVESMIHFLIPTPTEHSIDIVTHDIFEPPFFLSFFFVEHLHTYNLTARGGLALYLKIHNSHRTFLVSEVRRGDCS